MQETKKARSGVETREGLLDGSALPPNQVWCPFEIRVQMNFITASHFPQLGNFLFEKSVRRKNDKLLQRSGVRLGGALGFFMFKNRCLHEASGSFKGYTRPNSGRHPF